MALSSFVFRHALMALSALFTKLLHQCTLWRAKCFLFAYTCIMFVVLICVGVMWSVVYVSAQTVLSLYTADSTAGAEQPYIRFGFDKILNTFIMRGDAGGVFTLPIGTLTLRQQYRGRALRTVNTSVRDDEDVALLFRTPIDTAWSVIVGNATVFSADSRSLQLNRLLTSAVLGGIEWRPRPRWTLSVQTGGEYNEQLGIVDRGWTLAGRGIIANDRIESLNLFVDGSFARSALTNNRTNQQINLQTGVSRTFDGGEEFELSGNYYSIRRDFHTSVLAGSTIIPSTTATNIIERRGEEGLRSFVRVLYPLSSWLVLDAQGAVERAVVNRTYQTFLVGTPFTAVDRTVEQMRLATSLSARMALARLSVFAEMQYEGRDEFNRVIPQNVERFPIREADLLALRSVEVQRDFLSSRIRLFLQGSYILTPRDTLRAVYSSTLLRYDTPSDVNYDDRDELTVFANIGYGRQFSSYVSAGIFIEARLLHTVFVKAQRSAQNNWVRTLRLVPHVRYRSDVLTMSPEFELLANYTSFDFESLIGSIQSFSFRQIAYRDSLSARLTKTLSIDIRPQIRYFERGEFRWDSFTEIPRDRTLEVFVRSLVVTHQTYGRIGLGVRYYDLHQQPIVQGLAPEFRLTSIAPEVLAEISVSRSTQIRLNGWYERQTDGGGAVRYIPNMIFTLLLSP
jgi:hypothetical protein